jgi:predicted hydrocarbon binding protein
MIDPEVPNYYFSHTLSRILLLSMEDIIGHAGLNAVLNQAGLKILINNLPPNDFDHSLHFDEISRIQFSLEKIYGSGGGRGLALRSGRVFFQVGLREFAGELGFNETRFRLLPLDKKILAGLDAWAKLLNFYSTQNAKVEDTAEHIFWINEPCPFCWNRTSCTKACYFEVGILQEAVYWISGGKFFVVDEIKCIALGDPSCTIAITKSSLD